MKRISLFLIVFISALVLFSCRGGETKADPEEERSADGERKTEEKISDKPSAAAPARPDSIAGSNEILAKIDQYLVSIAAVQPGANGMIAATVTIKNTLKDITFQKAIVEVTFLGADGKEIKNDFYTIQNIEPGDVETIKVPASKGTSIVTHIVKVKSNELTNGEMVMSGAHFSAGQ